MGKKVVVELNSAGIQALLKSDEVQTMLQGIAQQNAQGWNTDVKVLNSRAVASIYSTDYDEVAQELDTHSIVGGLG